MQRHCARITLPLVVALPFFLAFVVSHSSAQEKIPVAGKITATVTDSHVIEVGDTEGHVFMLSKSEGTNTSTGKKSFMDGALTVNSNFGDFVGMNGPHQGFIVFTKEGETIVAQWKGTVTSTLSSGNTRNVSMEGTYKYIRGTLQYEGIQGGGTYRGKYLSEKTYVVEWDGEYSITK